MTHGPLPRPRDWVGAAAYPWPAVHSLGGGAAVIACFAVAGFQLGRTRQDKSYLKIQLGDRHGIIEGRVWDDAEQFADWLRPGVYVGVRGHLEIFNGERQLRIDALAPIRVALEELELFVPRSARDPHLMDRELSELIESVRDTRFRTLLERMLGEGSETGRGFRLAPAAKQNHHAYLGGLLEHTLSVAHLCDALARHYDADIDRDLLITAALLHDIGKVREIGAQAGFPYTNEGKLLGHILLGLQMVATAAAKVPELAGERLLLLQHLIASHQGRYEWQSPREPRILEGLLLHYADDLDAKANQAQTLIAGVAGGWTAYDRGFGRDFLRHRVADPEIDDAPAEPVIPAPRRGSLMPAPPPDTAAPGRSSSTGSVGKTTPAPNGSPDRAGAEAQQAPPTRGELAPDHGSPAHDTLDLFGESTQGADR